MDTAPGGRRAPWWLALAALALCGPWPGWSPAPAALAAVAAGLALLARPRRHEWWPWVGVAAAVVLSSVQPRPAVEPALLELQLGAHCSEMMAVAEEVADDATLRRLVAATGEALKPELPFTVLRRQLAGGGGRTLYLADDRGRLVAWAGHAAAYPPGARPLGQRTWGIAWSAGGATLWVREPILIDGRLVGAVTVADATPLQAPRVWGMAAPFGCELVLGQGPDRVQVQPSGRPGVEVPVGCRLAPSARMTDLAVAPWLMVAAPALIAAPWVGAATVVVGGGALALAPGALPSPVLGGLLLLGGLAAGRVASGLGRRWARAAVVCLVALAAVVSIVGPAPLRMSWLPSHLLRPGWGGVWMVALALVVAAWSRRAQPAVTLGRLLAAAGALAGLALAVEVVRLPIGLLEESQRARGGGRSAPGVVLPRRDLDLGGLLPAPPEACRVDDLAPTVARTWGLERWSTPSELTLVDGEGLELSRWGDLAQAGEAVLRIRSWPLAGSPGWRLELAVAVEPWSWLGDWRAEAPVEPSPHVPVWFAVLTRSGSVAATLHPEVRNLEAATAGDLWHAGAGWASVTVGDAPQLARVRRQGDFMVAAIARSPAPSVWVVQAAVACLWALVGLVLARPPAVRRAQLSTFGGRLRMLVACGVVLPLVILTLFLHLRLRREEQRLDQVAGLDALRAARFTAISLAEGLEVDDGLAQWLERLVGGEVVLFDGAEVAAASRRDFLATGLSPSLPLPAVFPHFLLGRDDPVVRRQDDRLVAAGAVELEGRRYLLQVYPTLPLPPGEAPEAVDWLLTGAALAALAVLLLTSRVERRLSASLRDLVGLAGRLLEGEPVGPIRRPRETDLAEVLDAVRSMSEEVQERERSLRHQEELLRITLATLAPAVMVLERDGGQVRFANPSACQLLELHRERVLRQVRAMADRATVPDAAVVETVQPLPGQELTWRVGVAGVPLPDGSRGLVAVVDDVTDLVRADRLRQLNQLARIVAHEVKNPLTPIRLWVQELEEAQRRGDPEVGSLLAEACREISTQVGRLQSTASSFSNLVALESWSPRSVDATELVEETLAGLGVLARRGITVHRELPAAGTCRVVGDREWIRRALDNLVKNSVDALDGPGQVWVRVVGGEERVAIEVEDSAGGVPDSTLERLFSPHFSTTTGGSGLGLALVHQVVVRCHGKVAARNGPHGLVVRLELPRE
jgi:signal transduction histidine kinase